MLFAVLFTRLDIISQKPSFVKGLLWKNTFFGLLEQFYGVELAITGESGSVELAPDPPEILSTPTRQISGSER